MTSRPPDAPDTTEWTADRIRLWSLVCAVLFVPVAGIGWLLTYLGDADCLNYGEGCPAPLPGVVVWTPAVVAVLALFVVLLLPERVRHAGIVRRIAFAVQGIAQTVVLSVVVLPR
ncbi:hypothetical protein ABZ714_31060 [Streptomyces sp. NPDC006798]|uniref:hypothetical protein n=1 Tax=Streptomyces sp. NPDC006798 TaxID=3155462 RepID=UPI0033D1CAAA